MLDMHTPLFLFPVAPTLEHRASVKHFVLLQFLNPKKSGRTSWTKDQTISFGQEFSDFFFKTKIL
jgi:hypothetical protein